MLSSIGRAAIRRVGAGASQLSTTRSISSIWHLQCQNVSKQLLISLARKYATASKATSTTKPTGRKTAVKTKSKSKSTTTKSKPKTKSKSARGKKATRKTARKPKTSKGKARKPKRRVLTERQKELRAKARENEHIQELKVTALLNEPKTKPSTAWRLICSEKTAGHPNPTTRISEASTEYKRMSPAELEQYNHTANQNAAANAVAYKQWVESKTPQQIRQANSARSILLKNLKKSTSKAHTPAMTKYRKIKDDRQPSRPLSAWLLFCKDRWQSGDLKGIKIADAARILSIEFKELTASQRKAYDDRANGETRRFDQEYKTVFKHDRPRPKSPAKAA